MTAFIKRCCCCDAGDDVYEEIVIGEGSHWARTLFDASSSSSSSTSSSYDSEEEDALGSALLRLNHPRNSLADEGGEKSVEDDEYYHSYMPNAHRIDSEERNKTRRRKRKRSVKETLEKLRTIHTKTNGCIEVMKRSDYKEIIMLYEQALLSCPTSYRHRLIKEYETFRDAPFASAFYRNTEDYKKAMQSGLAYWQSATLSTDDPAEYEYKKNHFRMAIMCMPEVRTKRVWKKEYNVFLSRIKNEAVII